LREKDKNSVIKKKFAIDKIFERLAAARIKTPFKILGSEWGL